MEAEGRHEERADVFTPEQDGVDFVVVQSDTPVIVQYDEECFNAILVEESVLSPNRLDDVVEVLYQFEIRE